MREEPYLKANLEIVEARSLVGKDMSGSSDPFCTCYLTTNPISRFNTSYKVSQLLSWLNSTQGVSCARRPGLWVHGFRLILFFSRQSRG